MFINQPDDIVLNDLNEILKEPLPWEELSGSRILVTGASGFIGGHIVEFLVWLKRCKSDIDLTIYAMARDLAKLRQRMPWVLMNNEVQPLIQDVIVGCEGIKPNIIFHAASPASPRFYLGKPVETILANSYGTQKLLELAHSVSARFLFLSSGAVYGDNVHQVEAISETDFGSDDPLSPRACYSESKRLAETLCQSYHRQYALDTRIARISHCYGPGLRLDDGRAIADLMADVIGNRDIHLDSDGSASRPFCYISDTVLSLFYILFKGEPGNAYNVGETKETTILDLAKKIIAVSDKTNQVNVLTKALDSIEPASRNSGHFDISKIKRLGWTPRVNLDDGLCRMFKSYASNQLDQSNYLGSLEVESQPEPKKEEVKTGGQSGLKNIFSGRVVSE